MPQLLQDKPNVFQHDGAPPRIRNEVTAFLNRQLPERWIGRRGSTSWSPRSPDLNPLEVFLWSFVKDEVYVPPVSITLKNLKDRIRTATAQTDQPLLQSVWQEVEHRLDVYRATNGAHTELA
jgi:hypothetical protein